MLWEPLRLSCPVMHYDWGDPRAIPALIGRSPDERPGAELWMGAQPKAPATVATPDGEISLRDRIAEAPWEFLGPVAHDVGGGRLPFLAKILAASRSLSIQCHPNPSQASVGFEREQAAGVPLDAAHRNYRDASHKPELMIALQPFAALYGLRPAAEIVAAFERKGLREPAAGLQALRERGDEALSAFVRELLSMRGQADALIAAALKAADADDEVERWIGRLAAQHPGDTGALAPLFMNVVTLQPLEGVYLGAGQLHAYLEGVGVEVMAASDNVLRAGLTTKHIDLDELMHVGVFAPTRPNVLKPQRDGAVASWPTPAEEFRVSRLDVGGRAPARDHDRSVDLLLVTEGRIDVVGDGFRLDLERGQACVVPAAAGAYALEGAGVAWRVTVP